MPGHNRGCPNRQSIGADAWHVLSQRNPANGVVRLYLSFPGEEFHINDGTFIIEQPSTVWWR